MMAQSQIVFSSWGWARLNPGTWSLILVSSVNTGLQTLGPSWLPLRVCISRKLEWKAELGLETKDSGVDYDYPKQRFNYCAKHLLRYHFSSSATNITLLQ